LFATVLGCNAGAHRHDGNAVAAIKSSSTVQMSNGALDARANASPATGVSVQVLHNMRVRVRGSVRRCTLLQSNSIRAGIVLAAIRLKF
jgi:hypothetical protein